MSSLCQVPTSPPPRSWEIGIKLDAELSGEHAEVRDFKMRGRTQRFKSIASTE